MAARFPFDPFAPEKLPSAEAPTPGLDPIFGTIFRAAISGADAYRLTRAAVRREGTVLRLGNRFVPADQFREIGFVAVGHAAVSQALAVSAVLGERLTQGFVAGPDPLPAEVPFRSEVVGAPAGASAADGRVAAAVLELAAGLGPQDLLLALLSPGASPLLVDPPAGLDRPQWSGWLDGLRMRGATSREAGIVSRVIGRGAAGGRLSGATRATVVPLVLDRGDGPELVGGGPTRGVTVPERQEARAVLQRIGALAELPAPARSALDGPSAGSGSRAPITDAVPTAVAQPADALREVGAAVVEKRWQPVLAELSLDLEATAAAERLVARAERIRRDEPAAAPATGRPPKGLIAFAATTLAVPDGGDDRADIDRFLRAAARALRVRDASVAVFQTRGAPSGAIAPGLVVAASTSAALDAAIVPRPVPMRSGITDVGLLAAIVLPAS